MTEPATPPAPRPVQAAALQHIVRRLHRAPAAPWLHGEVARRMAERLALVKLQPAVVLDWWSFNGASRTLLQQAYPRARLVAVELDAARLPPRPPPSRWWPPRQWTARQDELRAPHELVPAAAGLLWANMMLHLVDDPAAQFRQWQQALAVDGFLMFSTLGPGSLLGLRDAYTRLGWPVPFAPFVDMHDLGDQLVGAGFADPVMDQEVLTLTWADADAALRELRSLGGNADPRRSAGLRTPRWRSRLEAALDGLKDAQGRVRLDFELVYGHAFKAAPKPRVAPRTTVALDEMRAMVRSPRRGGGRHDALR